jgi:hypothetical protein
MEGVGDFQPKTPARVEVDDTTDLVIETSPIKIESITKYNKPSERYTCFIDVINSSY